MAHVIQCDHAHKSENRTSACKGKSVLKSQIKVNFAMLLLLNVKIAIRKQYPLKFSMIR